MSEDEVRARVDIMIDQIRVVWGIILIVIFVVFFTTDAPWWSLPLSIFFGVVVYNLHIAIASSSLVLQIIEEGNMLQQAQLEIEIVKFSPEVVGRYWDNDVPEWIDVKVGESTERYYFADFAVRDGGSFVIPLEPNRLLFRGGVFQPAQS